MVGKFKLVPENEINFVVRNTIEAKTKRLSEGFSKGNLNFFQNQLSHITVLQSFTTYNFIYTV